MALPALTLLLLIGSVAAKPGATTQAPPPEGASLEEVWAWMSTLPSSDTDATFNINMYMAYNQMSMTDTKFTMDVGGAEEEEEADRMAGGGQEELKTWNWSWSPSAGGGGTVNMYMYRNEMTMEDTVFTMEVSEDGGMEGAASSNMAIGSMDRILGWMRQGGAARGPSINMYMYANSMAMDNTVFTMDVAKEADN